MVVLVRVCCALLAWAVYAAAAVLSLMIGSFLVTFKQFNFLEQTFGENILIFVIVGVPALFSLYVQGREFGSAGSDYSLIMAPALFGPAVTSFMLLCLLTCWIVFG